MATAPFLTADPYRPYTGINNSYLDQARDAPVSPNQGYFQGNRPFAFNPDMAPTDNFGMPTLPTPPPPTESTATDISKVLGKVSGPMAFVPFVGPILTGLSAAGSVLLNYFGAKEQVKENKRARELAQAQWDKQQKEEQRRYDVQTAFAEKELKQQEEQFLAKTALANRQQAHVEEIDSQNLAITKENQKWDKWLMVMSNMTRMMSTPSSRAGFAQLYQTR